MSRPVESPESDDDLHQTYTRLFAEREVIERVLGGDSLQRFDEVLQGLHARMSISSASGQASPHDTSIVEDVLGSVREEAVGLSDAIRDYHSFIDGRLSPSFGAFLDRPRGMQGSMRFTHLILTSAAESSQGKFVVFMNPDGQTAWAFPNVRHYWEPAGLGVGANIMRKLTQEQFEQRPKSIRPLRLIKEGGNAWKIDEAATA